MSEAIFCSGRFEMWQFRFAGSEVNVWVKRAAILSHGATRPLSRSDPPGISKGAITFEVPFGGESVRSGAAQCAVPGGLWKSERLPVSNALRG